MRRQIVGMLLASFLLTAETLGSSPPDSKPRPDEQGSEAASSSGSPLPRSQVKPAVEWRVEQEEAIAELRKLGCRFPEGPVVKLTIGCRVSDADLVYLKGLRNLRELTLDTTQLTNAGLVHLAELPSLQTLVLMGDLARSKLTGKGLFHLKNLESLRSLGLAFIRVDDADLAHIKAMKRLKSLSLCGSGPLGDKGVQHLKDLTDLETLVLDGGLYCPGPVLRDVDVEHMKALTGLRVLILRAHITDAGLAHLKGLTSLEWLGVHGGRVTDAGLVHLKGLTKLERLGLDGSQMTDAGFEHLEGLANLAHLQLYGTKVTEKGVASFQRVLPKVKVVYGPYPRP